MERKDSDSIEEAIREIKWFHTIKLVEIRTNGASSEAWQNYLSKAIPTNLHGESVLDIGCWDGYFSFLCEQRGAYNIVGIDDKHLDGAFLAKKILGSKVAFRRQSLFDLDDEKFDIVIFYGVYYHVIDLIKAFEKVCGITRHLLLVEGDVFPAFGNMPVVRNIIPEIIALEPSLTPPPNKWYWRPSFRALNSILRKFGFINVEIVGTYGRRRILLRCRR
jgi:tRNA (mo5U34)-methyltransferase